MTNVKSQMTNSVKIDSPWPSRILEGAAALHRGLAAFRKDAPLWTRDRAELDAQWTQDARSLRHFAEGIERVTRRLEESPDLFRTTGLLSLEQRHRLWGMWQSFLDYEIGLDGVKNAWADFTGLDPAAEPERHARGFLVAYAAFLAQYGCGLRVTALAEPVKAMHTLLNEEVPEFGIHPHSFARVKWNVIHVSSVTLALAGRATLHLLGPVLRRMRHEPDLAWALQYVRRARKQATREMKSRGPAHFAANTIDILRGHAFRTWFPVQKRVAQWFGESKVKDRTQRLIRPAQIAAMQRKLRPGDLLFERRNWCMSNIGLPGFWPHAAFYVGAAGEIAREFDGDAEVKKRYGAGGLTGHLRRRYAKKWEAFEAPHGDGHPHRVIEAVGEGVIFNSLEHSADADYVCALRPRLDAASRAAAIERAFHYQGRPYDFDFDFTSDATLVCSELVWKCYQPGPTQPGLDLPPIDVAGRPVLPPTEMIKQFVREYGTPKQQMDFVYFLDGREAEQKAVVGTLEEFLKSPLRPKWDFLQP
jgi:hypothetical protein